jgi:hypothetical protein
VQLNLVLGKPGYRFHCGAARTFLEFGPWQKPDQVGWVGADQLAVAAQCVIEVRLIEQRQSPSEIDAFHSAQKLVDAIDDFRADRCRRADRAPRFEMVGMKIDQRSYVRTAEMICEIPDQRRVPHRRVSPAN